MKKLISGFALVLVLSVPAQQQTASAQQYDKLDLNNQPLSNKVCATCHGSYGVGNPIVGGPSLAGLEPWYLKRQLESFRAKYRGNNKNYIPGNEMQVSVARLSDTEIEGLVSYIATWPPVAPEQTINGDAKNGSALYASCAACHGINGEGNELLGAPALAGRNDWYMARQLKLFMSGDRGGNLDDVYGQQMRAGVQALSSEQDINDVLAYVSTMN
ncbi:MAG: cytochrome c553 [Pseudohongiellaceae bacterium]|jgi:cytochrome c553